MKEVDPEVARLLDDIPNAALPPVLIKEGWGQNSMKDFERFGSKVPKKPEESQAPTYMETCCQCGRPITNARKGGGWWDHAGKEDCDGAIVAEREVPWHVPQSEYDEVLAYVRERRRFLAERRAVRDVALDQRMQKARQRDLARQAIKAKLAPCGAAKYSHSCPHECSQKGDHFGYHECKYCRHLWR